MRLTVLVGLALLLVGSPAASATDAHGRRIGKGFSWGRCLLVVGDKTLIKGRCGYRIGPGGELNIAGPDQVYDGIDYPVAAGCGACQQSKDYRARVFKDEDGRWTGYGNGNIRATHGSIVYRTLTQRGACFFGETDGGVSSEGEVFPGDRVKICAWRR